MCDLDHVALRGVRPSRPAWRCLEVMKQAADREYPRHGDDPVHIDRWTPTHCPVVDDEHPKWACSDTKAAAGTLLTFWIGSIATSSATDHAGGRYDDATIYFVGPPEDALRAQGVPRRCEQLLHRSSPLLE